LPSVELVIAAFLGIMTLASVLAQRVRLPYTVILVLLGMALAAFSLSALLGVNLLYDSLVGGGLFVGLVVPPLIFEAMMDVPAVELKAVIRPAVTLATAGVLIATVVGGLLLWQLANLPIYTSFLFAALIAPTDVATVLEVFRRAKVPSKLATLLETEAAFNDATGIVVFSILLASLSLQSLSFLSAVSQFVYVFGGGVLVGLLIAYAAKYLSHLVTDSLSQTALTISTVYGSYALASALGVSGLVAVAIVGLFYGSVTGGAKLPESTRGAVRVFWEIAAFLANSVAFLFIGLSSDIFRLATGLFAIATAYLAVTIARVASVYPILTIFDQLGQKSPLKWKNVAMLGGMRGALSIALAASLPASLASRDLIATMVLGVAFISILGQGPLLSRYIHGRFEEETLRQTTPVNTVTPAVGDRQASQPPDNEAASTSARPDVELGLTGQEKLEKTEDSAPAADKGTVERRDRSEEILAPHAEEKTTED
jgi:CPA1 family monovalent cation:H+ antiporter